ncbi:LysE family translocator [Aeromicrobium alkaliterrae]|uniref:LysE family translocator n=1 Tax=Aeromicrobium alkaliterrae TaxID=302168 RepID=A0ABN2JW89_9ACTN
MITTGQMLAFGLAALVLIAIPGPSVVFVIGRALVYGRAVALATVVGNSLGLLVIITAVALGLGVVVAESIVVFTVIKLVGAAYLVWLGVQALRHRSDFTAPQVGAARTLPIATAVRQGFVVGITNPKAFMIFGAVLPQFVDRGAGHLPVQMLLLGLLGFVIGLVSDGLWALIASRLREWFARSPRRGQAVGTVGGVSMVGLGVSLAVTTHR